MVKTFNIDTAKGEVNPRVQEITVRLVADLFKAIEDLDMSPHEVWKGMEFRLTRPKPTKLGLLPPGSALSALSTSAPTKRRKPASPGGTPRTIEGPLYV